MMSRRSYGYGSYGRRSYGSGSYYRGKNRGHKKAAAAVMIAVLLCIAGVGSYFFFFHNHIEKDTDKAFKQPSVSQQPPVQDTKTSSLESSADPNKKGYFDNNVFIYDKQGYELFYGGDDTATAYAKAVSEIKKAVGKDVAVYNMVVPTHSVFGMPSNYLTEASDEKANIQKIYSSYTEDVKPVDIYDTLNQHKSEYIYFHTDNNWTGLGAYYAFNTFCDVSGNKKADINSFSKGEIKDFGGSLLMSTVTEENPQGNPELAGNADTVIYYNIPGEYDCRLLENGADKEKEATLIAPFAEGANAYSAFIWGNNPYMKITSNHQTGKKLCIIKDSYGCALAPFTALNYDEIYIVDPQFYDGSVIDYIKKNHFTDILVINGIINANTAMRTEWIYTIIG